MEKSELTAQQRASKKYYEKMKNNPEYRARQNKNNLNHYHKIKNDPEFKAKVSEHKKIYYQNKKKEILLEIVL